MKKYLRILLSVIILSTAILFSSCTASTTETTPPSDSSSTEPASTPTEKIVWRVNSYLKQGYDQTLAEMYENVIQNIYDETGGLLELQTHWGNELGINAEDSLSALKKGLVEVNSITPAKLSGYVPGMAYESVAYMLGEPIEDWQAFADGLHNRIPIMQEVYGEFDARVLAYYIQPPQLYASTDIISTKPLYSLDDLDGLLLRCSSKDSADFWESFGAKYVPSASGEMYMALKTKVFDAAAQPADGLITYKLAEICPYLIKVSPIKDKYFTYGWAVNEKAFSELPADFQQIVIDNFAAYQAEADAFISGMGTTYIPMKEEQLKQTISEYGITVIEFPESDYPRLMQAAETKIVNWLATTDDIGKRLFQADMEALGRMDRYNRLIEESKTISNN